MVAFGAGRGWPYFDPDYDSLGASLNPPKVVIDNAASPDATLIKLDSTNRHGILLEVVQVLTDLDLFISKAYVSSDGGWFMDVFHVTDLEGNKITDEKLLSCIEESLEKKAVYRVPSRRYKMEDQTHVSLGNTCSSEHTAIELTGPDRPGLLSEIFVALEGLDCNVVSAEVWTHDQRVAGVIFVQEKQGGSVDDAERLSLIRKHVCEILNEDGDRDCGRTSFFSGLTHTERRLHQMMSADGNLTTFSCSTAAEEAAEAAEEAEAASRSLDASFIGSSSGSSKPEVTVRNCVERGYSVVSIRCRDRSKLLFDTVCTLTDMDYTIFHATILSEGYYAYQEFYIRHIDGCTLETESERQRLTKCLIAAIERRFSEGLRLELCACDRLGLLSDVTKVFREHGLSVAAAYVSTQAGMAVNTFYVTDSYGKPVDMRTVESIREEIGLALLQVKEPPVCPQLLNLEPAPAPRFSLTTFVRSHSERLLYSLGFIRNPPSPPSSLPSSL